jgi:hypothetical protein
MVREDEYLRLRAAEEDLEDVRLYDEAKAKPSEFIPLGNCSRCWRVLSSQATAKDPATRWRMAVQAD